MLEYHILPVNVKGVSCLPIWISFVGFNKRVLIQEASDVDLWEGFSPELLLQIDHARVEHDRNVLGITRHPDDAEIVCLGTGAALPSKHRNGTVSK